MFVPYCTLYRVTRCLEQYMAYMLLSVSELLGLVRLKELAAGRRFLYLIVVKLCSISDHSFFLSFFYVFCERTKKDVSRHSTKGEAVHFFFILTCCPIDRYDMPLNSTLKVSYNIHHDIRIYLSLYCYYTKFTKYHGGRLFDSCI